MIPDVCKIDSHLLIVSALVSTSLAIALIFNNSPQRTANAVKNLINFNSSEILTICRTSFSMYVFT